MRPVEPPSEPAPAPVPPQALCVPSSELRVATGCRPDGATKATVQPPALLLRGLLAPGIDRQGARLIEQFEGYSRCAYFDGYGGVWTVGFGQTRGAYQGFCFSGRAAAERNLIDSVNREYLWAVRETCGNACGQHQINGLVSFDYNLGAYIFRNVAPLKAAIHRGDFRTACVIMRHYAYAGGQYLPGLARRRGLECAEILRPSESPAHRRARLHGELRAAKARLARESAYLDRHRCRKAKRPRPRPTPRTRHQKRACAAVKANGNATHGRIDRLRREGAR
jgi:GH24 family phage-related lysozyme (muramidase)